VLIEQRPSDDSELAALVVDQHAELRVRDGGAESRATRLDPAVRYLVAVHGGDAVACGGIQSLDLDTAELRRMYVRPAYRGQGIAKRMLTALEEFAVSRGHTVLRLEAGVHFQEAIALYLSAGYQPIPRFGRYLYSEHSRCFEKRLDGTERAVRIVRVPVEHAAVGELTGAAGEELAGRYEAFVAAAEPRSALAVSSVAAVSSALPPSVDPGPAARFVRSPVGSAARFVVALVDGEPVGCGAIQPADDQTVELKRMYVGPAHRRGGIGRRMLAALEDLAAGSHYRVVRLEAGCWQPDAIRLYESSGYRPIPAYGPYAGNPYSRCYEKSVIATEPIASGSA
jgi:GNAT superfamily N-acetyltransferase